MTLFDVYIAIDFSGSKDTVRQRHGIAVAETEQGSSPHVRANEFTRFEAVWYLLQRILHHNSKGKRVLCGFDFQYSFPEGFWYALTGLTEIWGDIVRGMAEGVPGLPAVVEKPESNARRWAELANKKISGGHLGVKVGPFWGPNHSQSINPEFPFSKVAFNEYRLTEKRGPGFKPIFKVGGQGSVGLQSLCGMPYLFQIRTTCLQQKVGFHCWPFEGWGPEGSKHFMVEWYPALYNQGQKSDENDALACVEWAKEVDDRGELLTYLTPSLSDAEKARAAIEGWVLGIL